MMMPCQDSTDVPLALLDPTLLSCWEEMVKRGEECTLMLKHSKGKITSTLQSTKLTTSLPRPTAPSSSPAKKKRRQRGNKKKRLEALLSYHQRLVDEKGLPPSRLMMKHAVASSPSASSTLNQSPGSVEEKFKCDQCEFSSKSQRGLKVHTGRSHKDPQLPENLRCGEQDSTLNLSLQSQLREEDSSLVKADIEEGEQEESSISEEKEPAHKCPAFLPCTRLQCKLRREAEREEEALQNPCKNCDVKLYSEMCCAEEKELCHDCCYELGVCC